MGEGVHEVRLGGELHHDRLMVAKVAALVDTGRRRRGDGVDSATS
jgi:hypothetical protein